MKEDYKQTENGDLDFSMADLIITESTDQHQRDLLLADKGHLRNKPEAGVGVINFLIDNNPEDCLRKIRMEMAADGMKVNRVAFEDSGEIEIDANYGSDN